MKHFFACLLVLVVLGVGWFSVEVIRHQEKTEPAWTIWSGDVQTARASYWAFYSESPAGLRSLTLLGEYGISTEGLNFPGDDKWDWVSISAAEFFAATKRQEGIWVSTDGFLTGPETQGAIQELNESREAIMEGG